VRWKSRTGWKAHPSRRIAASRRPISNSAGLYEEKNPVVKQLLAKTSVGFSDLLSQEEGQALVEYALILLFVSVVVIGLLKVLGADVSGVFSKVVADFP
jgi:Flp pilus assembly pilin Flp